MSVGGVGGAQGASWDRTDTADAAAPSASAAAYVPSSGKLGGPDLAAVGRGEAEIAKGAHGDGVKGLQQGLIAVGKLNPPADGVFGPGTERAVAAFQRSVGLTPSGRFDRPTLEALDKKIATAAPQSARPAPAPLRQPAASYLKNQAERSAYQFCKDKLFTGASWRHGIDLAVTDEDTLAIMDKLETLPPASYNRVLHALAATKENDAFAPTLLDKMIKSGTSQFGNATLSLRFAEQLEKKLRPLGGTPENKIFQHISPDSVNRLEGWAGLGRLKSLIM